MTRRVVVHCGLSKTGTKSLQNFLALRKVELRALGYDYPSVGLSKTTYAHHNLALNILESSQFNPALGTADDAVAYLQRPDRSPNIVFSSEFFSVCFVKASAPERLWNFLRELRKSNDEVRVIFMFRTFWRRLESDFLECVKSGKRVLSIRHQIEDGLRWYRTFFGNVSELADLVGEDKIAILDTEHGFRDSISAMLATLGIEASRLPPQSEYLNVRPSLKKSAYLFHMQYGRDGRYLGRPQKHIAAISRAIRALPDFPGDETNYHVLSFDEANEIQANMRALIPPLFADRLRRLVEPELTPFRHVNLPKVELTDEDERLFYEATRHLLCIPFGD